MRLDRYIAESTDYSRRDAKLFLKKKRVTVDGEVQRSAAFIVPTGAQVVLNDEVLQLPQPIYLMMHKPKGVVSANVDDVHPTVMSILPSRIAKRAHIVGRLDQDTTGLLLITDDGDWTHAITSPKKHCTKTYRAFLAEEVSDEALEQLRVGVMLRNEKKLTKPALVSRVSECEVLLTIEEGRYHQVKRMFAAVKNRVITLHRESIGGLLLDAQLNPGEWRDLTDRECQLVFESAAS